MLCLWFYSFLLSLPLSLSLSSSLPVSPSLYVLSLFRFVIIVRCVISAVWLHCHYPSSTSSANGEFRECVYKSVPICVCIYFVNKRAKIHQCTSVCAHQKSFGISVCAANIHQFLFSVLFRLFRAVPQAGWKVVKECVTLLKHWEKNERKKEKIKKISIYNTKIHSKQ